MTTFLSKSLRVFLLAFFLLTSLSNSLAAQCNMPQMVNITDADPNNVYVDYIGVTFGAVAYKLDIAVNGTTVYSGTEFAYSGSVVANLAVPLQDFDVITASLKSVCLYSDNGSGNTGKLFSDPITDQVVYRADIATIEEVYIKEPIGTYCKKSSNCDYMRVYDFDANGEKRYLRFLRSEQVCVCYEKIVGIMGLPENNDISIANLLDTNCEFIYEIPGQKIECKVDKIKKNATESIIVDETLSITPNPFTNFIQLKYSSEDPISDIEMFDLSGRRVLVDVTIYKVKEGEWIYEFDTNEMEKGLYIISIVNNGKKLVWKVLKE